MGVQSMVARRSCWFVRGEAAVWSRMVLLLFFPLGLGVSLLLFSAALPNCRVGRSLPEADRDGPGW